jgi:gamma-glutamyl:cysteine ligase YbdK (ATP-grasp superfamily)
MDAVERVEDATALAAYVVQALVKRAAEAPPPPPQSALEDALVRENKWQAIRYGLDATVIDATATPTPFRDRILQTLDYLARTTAELESERRSSISSGSSGPAQAPIASSRPSSKQQTCGP